MKTKTNRLQVLILAVLLTCACITLPVYAADSKESVVTDTFDTDGIHLTRVTADISSEFNVIIPKTITMNGRTQSAAYTVRMSGDIPANTAVNVTPDSSFLMASPNKPEVMVNVTQDKTAWTYTESDIAANGRLKAEGMTAGRWNGTFYFNIEFVELECPHEWETVTQVVHHDEVSHMETVVVKEAWDETITTGAYVCLGCNKAFTSEEYGSNDAALDAWTIHSWDTAWNDPSSNCTGYTTKDNVKVTIHHDAVTEKRKVVDKAAYDETIITGYICSKCNETKAP